MPRDRDDDDFNFKELLNLIKDLASKIVQSERGISLIAVVLGLGMKTIPRKRQIIPEYLTDSSTSPIIRDQLAAVDGNIDVFCREADKVALEKGAPSICEYVPEVSIDLVPIQLPGLPNFDDFGKVPISDLLIFAGAIGVAGFNVETVLKLKEFKEWIK